MILTILTFIIINIGVLRMSYSNSDPLIPIILEHKVDSIKMFINLTIVFLMLQYFCAFGEYEILKALNDKNVVQQEMESILSNLQEGIISKTSMNVFGFCNIKG